MTPERFGAYWLVDHIGEGGMGAVYIARRDGIEGVAGSERLCVVKTMLAGFEKTPGATARFMDEARLVTRLSHKNICPVLDVGVVDGRPYVAMDFVAGVDAGTLFNRLALQGRGMPPSVALYIINETLEALDHAHRLTDPVTGTRLGVVHRDVSPTNVMVTFEGEVKLIDFGIAKSSLQREITEKDTVVGKIYYMSPEQARGQPVDARTDVYAVGVTLYELLAGSRFWEGIDDEQLFVLLPRGGFVPAGITKLSPALRAFVSCAIAADPAVRFQTCAEMLEALDALPDRRDPGAGRGLTRLLDDECANEKRAIRARLAQASAFATPEDGGGQTHVSTFHAQDTAVLDPRAAAAARSRGSEDRSLEDPSLDDRSLEDRTVATDVPGDLGSAFGPQPVTDPSADASGAFATQQADLDATDPTSLQRKRRAVASAEDLSAAFSTERADPDDTDPPFLPRPQSKADAPGAAAEVRDTAFLPRPQSKADAAAAADTAFLPRPKSRPDATAAVELADTDPASMTRPLPRPDATSLHAREDSQGLTRTMVSLPSTERSSPSRLVRVVIAAAVLGVVVAAVAVNSWRLRRLVEEVDAGVPVVAALEVVDAGQDAAEVVDAGADVAEPVETGNVDGGRDKRPHSTSTRPPPPPKEGHLKEVIAYLERYCRKRVSCAPPILEKRASVGAMAAGDAARFVRNADGCARACANTR